MYVPCSLPLFFLFTRFNGIYVFLLCFFSFLFFLLLFCELQGQSPISYEAIYEILSNSHKEVQFLIFSYSILLVLCIQFLEVYVIQENYFNFVQKSVSCACFPPNLKYLELHSFLLFSPLPPFPSLHTLVLGKEFDIAISSLPNTLKKLVIHNPHYRYSLPSSLPSFF